jgi:hypothetical protein
MQQGVVFGDAHPVFRASPRLIALVGLTLAVVVGVLAAFTPGASAVSTHPRFVTTGATSASRHYLRPGTSISDLMSLLGLDLIDAVPGSSVTVHTQLLPASAPAAPAPAAPVPALPAVAVLPARGHATAYGCGPAMSYLEAYAAPGFLMACQVDTQGHQATTTCISGASRCSVARMILISVPCPAAYMNEASNSWVVMGLSNAVIDPYGYCH